jgi:mannose-1-phosphate guanylyltransferase
MISNNTWAVVLAGGEGNRLKALTTTASGEMIPKQFCSLRRRECLLDLALERAANVALPAQRCAVVAAQHRRWWEGLLERMPVRNIFVQPDNKGTAVGAALALLHIEARAPEAVVVLLPADHFVQDERQVAQALQNVADRAAADRKSVYLLGAKPEFPDSELGYIMPSRIDLAGGTVHRFIEKPTVEEARALIAGGALWNMFIVVAPVSTLLNLLDRSYNFINALRNTVPGKAGALGALRRVYKELPSVDLSRDVLAHWPEALKVHPVPPCGWTDLGTPSRVAVLLRQHAVARSEPPPPAIYWDLGRGPLAPMA